MLRLRYLILTLLLVAFFVFSPVAQACTGLRLIAKDNSVIIGRTMEFGFDVNSKVIVIPEGTKLNTHTARKELRMVSGFSYPVKHSIIGANIANEIMVSDGINDEGLYVGLHYFPGYASYPNLNEVTCPKTKTNPKGLSQECSMSPEEYGTWLLANFATVDEVRKHFNDVAMVAVGRPELGGEPAPVHYVVHDPKGNSVVIEPTDKQIKIHENPLGVFTNSPTFDWHMTNLSNYINLTVTNVPPVTLNPYKPSFQNLLKENNNEPVVISQFGQGSGLHGLPGDFTPPSRFVRAVAFSQSALPVDTAKNAIPKMFHIMNSFDIPKGAAREVHESEKGIEISADYTVWTSAIDLKNKDWYFRTYLNQDIRKVNLEDAVSKADGKIEFIDMDTDVETEQPIKDTSTSFCNAQLDEMPTPGIPVPCLPK